MKEPWLHGFSFAEYPRGRQIVETRPDQTPYLFDQLGCRYLTAQEIQQNQLVRRYVNENGSLVGFEGISGGSGSGDLRWIQTLSSG